MLESDKALFSNRAAVLIHRLLWIEASEAVPKGIGSEMANAVIDLARLAGLSPRRLNEAVGQLVTSQAPERWIEEMTK